MKFENSETLQCLINAFTGESLARNKYTIYAKIAKKEGYDLASEIFLETAGNEFEHAKLFYKQIPVGIYTPKAKYPFFIGNTIENLDSASCAECEEYEVTYKDSAQIAKSEGYDEISNLFKNISEIEKRHGYRFSKILEEIKNKTLYSKSEKTQWICTKCGYTHIGNDTPKICPVCKHEQKYFKRFTEQF